MNTENKMKIPTKYLPKDWREIGAKEFNLSISAIEKIVGGHRSNAEVFDYMLALALDGKNESDKKIAMLKALNK